MVNLILYLATYAYSIDNKIMNFTYYKIQYVAAYSMYHEIESIAGQPSGQMGL